MDDAGPAKVASSCGEPMDEAMPRPMTCQPLTLKLSRP